MRGRWFEEFCNLTGIGSFKYISAKVSKPERIFWLTATSTGILFTCFFCYSTLSRFYEESTATSLTIERNSSLVLAPPVLCVEIDPQAMLTGIDTEWLNASEVEFHLEQFLSVSNSRETNVFTQPQYVGLALITNTLMNFVKLESTRYSRYKIPQMWELDMYDLLKKYDVESLTRKVGSALSKLMGMRVERYHSDKKHRVTKDIPFPVNEQDITWLGIAPFQEPLDPNYLCVKLSGRQLFQFESEADYTKIIFDTSMWYRQPYTPSKLNRNAYLLFSGQRVKNPLSLNPLQLAEGKAHVIAISLFMAYGSMNSTKSPCSYESIRFDCVGMCRVKFYQNNCGCWPLSWFFDPPKPADIPFCGQNINMTIGEVNPLFTGTSCAELNITEDPNHDCSSKCLHECNGRIFKYERRESSATGNQSTSVTLIVDRFVHIAMQEVLGMDRWTLLSNLGGDLWFLVGASFISVTHVITFIFGKCLSRGWNKVRPKDNNNLDFFQSPNGQMMLKRLLSEISQSTRM